MTFGSPPAGLRTAGAAALVVGAVALLANGVSVAATAKPTVRVSAFAPLTVTGAGFEPSEFVRITVELAPKTVHGQVRAGTDGRFTLRFRRARADRCSGWPTVTAVGSEGSRATFPPRKLPEPACPVSARPTR